MSATLSQLTLTGMRLRDYATFANFLPGSNGVLLNYLQALGQQPAHWFTYLWGKADCGRTHLLQACCLQAEKKNLRSVYLPLKDLIHLTPAIFDNLEECDVICVDDIEMLAGKAEWEEAFFHLYNRAHQAQRLLIVSANTAPRELSIHLADLASRLTAGTVFHVENLTDEEKLKALQLRGQNRGLIVPEDVAAFLLKRTSRCMRDLYALLDQLDQASLAAQRRLTIPFVKSVLNL